MALLTCLLAKLVLLFLLIAFVLFLLALLAVPLLRNWLGAVPTLHRFMHKAFNRLILFRVRDRRIFLGLFKLLFLLH